MIQTIKAIKVEFLSAEIVIKNPDDKENPEINILLSFQDVDEMIFNLALDNNNTKDLFVNLLNVYASLGCPTAAVIKQFLQDHSE